MLTMRVMSVMIFFLCFFFLFLLFGFLFLLYLTLRLTNFPSFCSLTIMVGYGGRSAVVLLPSGTTLYHSHVRDYHDDISDECRVRSRIR